MERLTQYPLVVRGLADVKRSLPVVVLSLCLAGCAGGTSAWNSSKTERLSDTVVDVLPVYGSNKPWISFDEAGDRDPEGFKISLYLIDGETKQGAFGDGNVVVEMYTVDPRPDGRIERTLAKSWRFGPHDAPRGRKPTALGWGYLLHLDWRPGDYAGRVIEVAVVYERTDGRVVRSVTKQLRVPRSSRDRRIPLAASPRP